MFRQKKEPLNDLRATNINLFWIDVTVFLYVHMVHKKFLESILELVEESKR